MNSIDIRQKFLDFFQDKDHKIVESDLLVPRDDPTLLFTGAGMNQFKQQFMGRDITYKRAASCQKCLRTADVENVGKTPRHHTFFEMLGNFSFGDYFKKEAIKWGWEFMTKEMGIPEEKLWISVYKDDDESYGIWLNEVKVPAKRIIKLGAKDNFWPADAPTKGPNGPCGPCSEIFYDWGEETGCGRDSCDPSCDCGRFVEIWNLVFTEFERKPNGSLVPLPNKNIDTGMGLERVASVMQNVRTNFETDLFALLTESIRKELAVDKGDAPFKELCLIADHIRAAAFCIADGVSPSNEKQGYVIRKLIRRAYLRGNRKGSFLYKLVPILASIMGGIYPEIREKAEHISAIIEEEEKRFHATLSSTMPVFEIMISNGIKSLGGEQIFKLVDTYGLPLDVMKEEAEKRGVSLDIEKFDKLMEGRKEQSRKGSDMISEFIFQPNHFSKAPKPDFSDDLPLEASLEFILKGTSSADELCKGDLAEIIVAPQSSRFYAESGGQVGDTGSIIRKDNEMEIVNTFEADGKKVFAVRIKKGCFKKGEGITVSLDSDRKGDTARNHTATHLLHTALRNVLGEHVKQSGSFVDNKRLRFDFTHMKKLSDRELRKIEDMVNVWIGEGIEVYKEVKNIEEAKKTGALSFFGEKYGDTVRVVSIAGKSKEFCGGTHVDNTGDIEMIKITAETSVASGIRRIEAVTGDNARVWIVETLRGIVDKFKRISEGNADTSGLVKEIALYSDEIISGKTKINSAVLHDFGEKIKPAYLEACECLERVKKKQQKQQVAGVFNKVKDDLDKAVESCSKIGNINFVSCIIEDVDMAVLKKAAGYIGKKVSRGIVLLAADKDDGAYLICIVDSCVADDSLNARVIINGIAGSIGGSGGGNPTFAQAGGNNPSGLYTAVEEAKQIIEKCSRGGF